MWQEVHGAHAGGLISVRGGRWQVLGIEAGEGCEAWRLRAAGCPRSVPDRTLLVPFDRPRLLQRSRQPRRVGRRAWIGAFRGLLGCTSGFQELRTPAAARIDLLPYQLEPVLACVGGATRVLIADEVGLGKTIQAGLVIAELAARGQAGHVLVVAPAGLCAQWQQELETRFRVEAAVVDAAAVQRLNRWGSSETSPWERVAVGITSVDFVKRPEVLIGLGASRYDLLVVDEAHTCALARERAAAISWLGRRSRRVLLLTATPHAGDVEGFRALCDLGHLPGEPPPLMFRRTRATLGQPVCRRIHLLRTLPTDEERALHGAFERYARRVWKARPDGPGARNARLAMLVLGKRAASGPSALHASLERRLEWLARADAPGTAQLLLPLGPAGADLDEEDDQPGAVLAAAGLEDVAEERAILSGLVERARAAARAESKTRVLRRLLARVCEPAIVFTEYRDTLTRLADALAPSGPIALLHGGLDQRDRQQAARDFTEGRAAVLLATDAAAHGLNLQAGCRLVVNYELPWNPVRLEQRVGRVDRIGQRRRVHAVHLVSRGACEERVMGHLLARVERARGSMGPVAHVLGRVSEWQVAEAAFAGRRLEIGAVEPPGPGEPGTALAVEAGREAGRLERVRLLLRPRARGGRDPLAWLPELDRRAPWLLVLRGSRAASLPRGLTCLCRSRLLDGEGVTVDEALVLVRLEEGRRPRQGPLRATDLAALVWTWRPAIERAAAAAVSARLETTRRVVCLAAERLGAREAALLAEQAGPAAPVQPGLFDRRALVAADREAQLRRRLEADGGRRLAALTRSSVVGEAAWIDLLLVLANNG